MSQNLFHQAFTFYIGETDAELDLNGFLELAPLVPRVSWWSHDK